MFGAKLVPAAARTLVALTLATGLAAGTARPADASMTDAYMACGEGTEVVYFGFPQEGAPRMSIFAYRLDGGAWKYTNWYYTSNGFSWLHDASRGRWIDLPGGIASFNIAGNNHLVEGYEYRYNPSTRAGGWIPLKACRTSSFFNGGITYR